MAEFRKEVGLHRGSDPADAIIARLGELHALEAFPRLISLDLENLDLGWRGSTREATLAAFAQLDLAASLRELSMPWPNGLANPLREVAAAFGPLLELFEYPAGYADGPSLAGLVAGATIANRADVVRHLPIAPRIAPGPWLSRGVVEYVFFIAILQLTMRMYQAFGAPDPSDEEIQALVAGFRDGTAELPDWRQRIA